MNKRVIHKIIKKTVAGAVTLSLILSLPAYSVANADTLSDLKDQYKSLQTQQQQAQNKINELKSKVSSAKEKENAINASVKIIDEQLVLIDSQIVALNSQIKTINENIEKIQKEIDEETEKYKERVCTIYEVGNASKLEVLLTSNDLSDFFVKYDTIKTISEYDKKLKDDLTSNRDKLKSQKESLDAQKAKLQDAKDSADAKMQLKKSQLAEAKKVTADLESDKAEKVSEEKALNQKRLHTDAEIEKEEALRIARNRQQYKAQGGPPITNSDIVKEAREYLGVRYRLGAASKSAIDCSGLVMLVLGDTVALSNPNLYLPHSAAKLSTMGTAVSRDNLQPGDVVFFKIHHSYVDHCGIYTGNGWFIAANSGSRMCVYEDQLFGSAYWSRYYVGARRIR